MYYTQKHSLKNELWQYTTITVPKSYTPYYRLYTGGQHQRFILSSKSYSKYWGVVEPDYYGVNLLHNPEHWTVADMPIKPITSQDVEAIRVKIEQRFNLLKIADGDIGSKGKKKTNEINIEENIYYQQWSVYFAQALMDSKRSFLHRGEWRLFPTYCSYEGCHDYAHPATYDSLTRSFKRTFCSNQTSEVYRKHYNPNDLTCANFSLLKDDDDIVPYIDWTSERPYPLIYNHKPDAGDGRVKWWRKKVRENTCPPLLVWFQDHLQSHLLIDGHARLQAYLLENQVPRLLTVAYIKHQVFKKSDEIKQKDKHILLSIANNLEHGKNPMSVDKINQLMIDIYNPNHACYRSSLIAKPLAHMDSKWVNEVKAVMDKYGLDKQELDKQGLVDFISNKGGDCSDTTDDL